jgi:prepilin-type N-terminal cleavage/methylation domain-containing protein
MLHTRKGGFTLIELMIVVAIIGILAAIAIPNFLQFQLRSKTGEAKTNIAAIRTAEEGYFAEFNNYVLSVANPPTAGTQNKQPWPTGSGFDNLGWSPEGQVFFQYSVNAPTGVGLRLRAPGGARRQRPRPHDGQLRRHGRLQLGCPGGLRPSEHGRSLHEPRRPERVLARSSS